MYNQVLSSHHTLTETSCLDALGIHLLLELRKCNSKLLDDLEFIRQAMTVAAKGAGATIVGESFHQFDPRGVTGIVAIAESHLCIHTWPEHQYAAVDIFTCGNSVDPWCACELLKAAFEAERGSAMEIHRGRPDVL